MKKNLFILAVLALAFQSCDYVGNPHETITDGGGGTDSTVHTRRVLVEDYTGHKCPNCPQAALVAEALDSTYDDKVVIVALHASGVFATPTTPAGAPAGSYLVDYRTAAGNAYNSSTYFNFSAYPNGMINRRYYTPSTTTHIIPHTSWASEVASLLALPAVADLTITNTYNSTTRSLSINTVSEFVSDTLLSGTYKLIVMITQDSIVDWQENGTTHVPDYLHMHVLRDNVNGTWGDTLVTGSFAAHTQVTKNYVYTLPSAYPTTGTNTSVCDENHCHVVAFIYNTANYEVIQAAEAKVTP